MTANYNGWGECEENGIENGGSYELAFTENGDIKMDWEQVINKVKPYIVRIETPTGYGTGFLCLYNVDKSLCGIATAQHVVNHSDEWEQPIRIRHNQTGKVVLLKERDRIIYKDWKTDSAVIIFQKGDFPLPAELIQLYQTGSPISIGIEVGWLGFPQIQSYTLCFFSGNISAWQEFRKAYLIDGVAISGVSGGPVLYCTETEGVQIVGTISAYSASRVSGEALPGLSIAQDVSHFHDVISRVRSIDEAKKKKQELEETKQANGVKQESYENSASPSAGDLEDSGDKKKIVKEKKAVKKKAVKKKAKKKSKKKK